MISGHLKSNHLTLHFIQLFYSMVFLYMNTTRIHLRAFCGSNNEFCR
jgi:hypothetical protein